MKFVMYRDSKDEWRWSLYSRNGRIIADSGEGYKYRGKCRRAIERIVLQVAAAKIEE